MLIFYMRMIKNVRVFKVSNIFIIIIIIIIIINNNNNNNEFICPFILQAGHILTIHSKHKPRLIRWIIWAVIMVG